MELLRKIARPIRRKLRQVKSIVRYYLATEYYSCDPAEAFAQLSQQAPSPGTSALTDNHIEQAEFDLTIIVPAYNAEKWICECMDSVLNQDTSYSYKVIAVNDGSVDQTPALLERYASDSRVTIVHQENRGHSGARNCALRNINSKYVMFVDSDDIFLPGAV